MTVSYPLDILADFPGWTTTFELLHRQEHSRTAGGVTYVKELGSPLWRLSAVSRSLAPNLLDEWRARLDALEDGLKTFKGYSLSRCFPIAYPDGLWPTGGAFNGETAVVHAIGSSNRSLRLGQQPAGFQLRPGDLIQIKRGSTERRDLHRVIGAATAAGDGITPEFEVRPHLWPGVAVDDLVSVKRPWCLMAVVPGTISSTADPVTGRGTVSFEAMEMRP